MNNNIVKLNETKVISISLYDIYLAQAGQYHSNIDNYHENEHDNSGGHPDYHDNSHDNTPGRMKVKKIVKNGSN